MGVEKGLHRSILHSTANQPEIDLYERVLREKRAADPDFKMSRLEMVDLGLKMIADVVEAIIGAVFLDSMSIDRTREFWEGLFTPYLEKYADDPEPHPQEALGNLFQSHPYLNFLKARLKDDSRSLEKGHLHTWSLDDRIVL